jgi:hypothetical protein
MVRKIAAASGLANRVRKVFQGQSGDADRDGGDDEQPGEAFVGVGGDDAAGGDAEPMWVTPLQTSDHVKSQALT